MFACQALAAEDHPRAEVFGGYQYTRVGMAPGIGANGWNAAVTLNANRWFGVTADFSGAYQDVALVGLRAHTFTFGPTVALRGERVTPFAHVLLGGFRGTAGSGRLDVRLSGFAMLTGGGVDVKIWKGVSARAFQLDWLIWSGVGMTEKKNARVSAGIVIGIG